MSFIVLSALRVVAQPKGNRLLEPYSDMRNEKNNWLYVGGSFGISFTSHSANVAIINEGVECCRTTGGNGSSPFINAKGFIPVFDNSSLMFSPRVSIEGMGGQLTTPAQTYHFRGANNIRETITLQKEIDARITTLGFDALLSYHNITPLNLYVVGGLHVAPILSSSYTLQERIVQPSDIRFRDQDAVKQILSEGSFDDITKAFFALRMGIGLLPKKTFLGVVIAPEVLLSIPLQGISKQPGTQWNTISVLFSVSLMRRL